MVKSVRALASSGVPKVIGPNLDSTVALSSRVARTAIVAGLAATTATPEYRGAVRRDQLAFPGDGFDLGRRDEMHCASSYDVGQERHYTQRHACVDKRIRVG